MDNIALIYSTIILVFFILVIDLTKKGYSLFLAKSKKKNETYFYDPDVHQEQMQSEEYKKEEFKPVFLTTFLYTTILLAMMFKQNNFPMLKDYFYLQEGDLNKAMKGSLLVFVINSILFAGFLFQLVLRIEKVSIEDKSFILIFRDVIYGPILEEIIYRGIIFNILRVGEYSNTYAAFLSSLSFGFCKYFYF